MIFFFKLCYRVVLFLVQCLRADVELFWMACFVYFLIGIFGALFMVCQVYHYECLQITQFMSKFGSCLDMHRDVPVGRVVSASGSEKSVSSSTPASTIIYDAYTSLRHCVKSWFLDKYRNAQSCFGCFTELLFHLLLSGQIRMHYQRDMLHYVAVSAIKTDMKIFDHIAIQ